MEIMDTLPTIVTAALALLSPLGTAIFTKTGTSPVTKNNVAVGVSFAVAIVYVVLNNGVTDWNDLNQIVAALPPIYLLQQLSYKFLIKDWTKAVEANVGAGAGAKDGKHEAGAAPVVENPVVEAEQLEETPAKG